MGLGASLAHAQQRHAPEEAPVTTASPDGVVLNHNPADQSTHLTISEALALGPALTTVVPQTAVDLSSEHAPWLPKAASLGALLSLFAAVAGRQAGAWLVSAKEGHIVDHVGEAARQGVGVVVGVGEGVGDLITGVAETARDIVLLISGDEVTRALYRALLEALRNDFWGVMGALVQAFGEPIVTDWQEGRYGEAVGRMLFELLVALAGVVIGGAGLAVYAAYIVRYLSKIGQLNKLLKVLLRAGVKVENLVRAGIPTQDLLRAGVTPNALRRAGVSMEDLMRSPPTQARNRPSSNPTPDLAQLIKRYGDNARQIISKYGNKLGQDILITYDRVADIDGADRLMRDLLSGTGQTMNSTARGALSELGYAASLSARGFVIEKLADVINGKKAGDIVIRDGPVIDVKDHNWSSHNEHIINHQLQEVLDQAQLHRQRYPGRSVVFAFTDWKHIPQSVVNTLRARGITATEVTWLGK
jgi:hypothetical protein